MTIGFAATESDAILRKCAGRQPQLLRNSRVPNDCFASALCLGEMTFGFVEGDNIVGTGKKLKEVLRWFLAELSRIRRDVARESERGTKTHLESDETNVSGCPSSSALLRECRKMYDMSERVCCFPH